MLGRLFDLVEYTHKNVFLTGKAGTGKTTFLGSFIKKTQKKHIVLAPTGVAAMNAGGSTVHSMFGLPLKGFLPTHDKVEENLFNNIPLLVSHFRFRKDKLKLFRELELIIIDEVSMLRADVLDMVDYALKYARRNTNPFGGVQLLLVGDLYQIPPVVKENSGLSRFYSSPFFFR